MEEERLNIYKRKIRYRYLAQHPNFNAWDHFFLGLGLAWLLSLLWQGYSLISLVLGIVFLVAGTTCQIYAHLAGRKMEIYYKGKEATRKE